MTGVIKSTFKSSTWINGVTNAVVKGEYTDYGAILSMPVKTGRVSLSSYPSSKSKVGFILKASLFTLKNSNLEVFKAISASTNFLILSAVFD